MKICKTLCICLSLLLFSCNKEKAAQADDNELEQRRELLRESQAKKNAKEAAEQQRLADIAVEEFEAKERRLKEQEMKLAEENRIKEEKIEQERLLQEKIIKDLRAKQKIARDKYIGTQYETLSVKGKEYKNLKVTRATDTHVSFLHASGVSNIEYDDLSQEVREACLYDKRTIVKEKPVQRPRVAKKTTTASKPKPAVASKSPQRTTTRPKVKPAPAKEKVKAVRSSGSIRTRVTRQYRKYFPEYRREYHVKDLSIQAYSNVQASLYFNNRRVMSVPPKKVVTFTGTSLPNGKYSITLKDSKGKVLDQEAHNRKSGL